MITAQHLPAVLVVKQVDGKAECCCGHSHTLSSSSKQPTPALPPKKRIPSREHKLKIIRPTTCTRHTIPPTAPSPVPQRILVVCGSSADAVTTSLRPFRAGTTPQGEEGLSTTMPVLQSEGFVGLLRHVCLMGGATMLQHSGHCSCPVNTPDASIDMHGAAATQSGLIRQYPHLAHSSKPSQLHCRNFRLKTYPSAW